MQIKLGLRQAGLSGLVFGGILLALVSVDARVRERVSEVMSGGDDVGSWGDRLSSVFEAVSTAVRYQSIENAPLMIFAVAGAVLFLFMFRA